MSSCPVNLRPDLEELPLRMQSLPVDRRGYPVPWFVAWVNGEPEFRAADPEKHAKALRESRCWVCGDRLGRHLAFVIGPMCGISRTTSEPACHLECARWSARNCPFLSKPQMTRRKDDFTETFTPAAGYMIERNPGVMLVWATVEYRLFPDDDGRPLISVGAPEFVEFYALGRKATRAEVEASVETGFPALAASCKGNQRCLKDLEKARKLFSALYPKT
jgi:hypothetical protein